MGDDIFGDAREDEAEGPVEEIAEDEAEDVAPKIISPDQGMPTQEEIDEHEVDHMPFRQWCEECMKGRGAGEQHRMCDGYILWQSLHLIISLS